MRAVLSPHIQSWANADWAEIASLRSPSLKILNTAADANAVGKFLDLNPGSSLLIRKVWGSPDDELRVGTGGKAAAEEAFRSIAEDFRDCNWAAWDRGRPVYVEFVNEVINPWDKMQAMSDTYAWFAEQCEEVTNALLPLAYSIPAGNPPGYGSADDPNHPNPLYPTRAHSLAAWIRHWKNGLEACDWRIAYHAYGAPYVMTEWEMLAGRTDLLTQAIDLAFGSHNADEVRYWLTEAGIDGGVYSGRKDKVAGWRGQLDGLSDDPEQAYADSLEQAARVWGNDPSIVAVYPFLHGAQGDWTATGFRLDGTPKIARMWNGLHQEALSSGGNRPMEYQKIDIQIDPGLAVLGQDWRCVVHATMNGQPCADGSLTLEIGLPRNPDGDVLYSKAPLNNRMVYALNQQGQAVTSFLIPEDALGPSGKGSITMKATVVDFAATPAGTEAGFGVASAEAPISAYVPVPTPAGPGPQQPGPTPEPFTPINEAQILPPVGSGYHRIFAIAGLQSQYAGKIQELTAEVHQEIDRIKANPQKAL